MKESGCGLKVLFSYINGTVEHSKGIERKHIRTLSWHFFYFETKNIVVVGNSEIDISFIHQIQEI